MNSSSLPSRLALIGCLSLWPTLAHAQAGVSPEAAPGRDEATSPASILPSPALPPGTASPGTSSTSTSNRSAPVSRLSAPRVTYEGGTIVAQGDATTPALLQSPTARLQADELRVNTLDQSVQGRGNVRLSREVVSRRFELRARNLERLSRRETEVQTLTGRDLSFNLRTRRGSLDDATIRSDVDVFARHIELDGARARATDAVVRPGGLSDEEFKIYGTPPLSLRAREVTATPGRRGRTLISARSAGLYLGQTRLLPLPATALRFGGGNNNQSFRLTPSVSFNSADRLLVATRLSVPLSSDPRALLLGANLGYSKRLGLRGGLTLDSLQSFGYFRVAAIRHDVVTTQLTNRLEVDRKPELTYSSPAFATFTVPGFGRSGFSFDGSYGSFSERVIGGGAPGVSSDRLQGRVLFSTRLDAHTGPFLRAFAQSAHYASRRRSYDVAGVEFGFAGRLLPRVTGEVSLRSSRISGQTPFAFDTVEIPSELRTTFDFELTRRFLVPIDLRYDLRQRTMRDSTFGLLRSYKIFAYGVVYQRARRDLRLEVRSTF